MIRYPTQSDHRYGDATNPPMPQGSNTYWSPGGLDIPQPAVTRDSEDRHDPSRLRADQLTSSAYASATPPFSLTHRDSYPTLGQTPNDCPGSAYHSGRYPPADPTSFHRLTTYDRTGYINADSQYGLPLGSQHQQNLVPDPLVDLRCDGSFDRYGTVTQHPALPVPPSSGSSELANALGDISTPEPRSTSRSSISLPGLPLPSQAAPKLEASESVIGLNPVKNEYGATASGQPFSPMTPLGSPSPYKEKDQESLHVGTPSIPRASTPLHGHSSLRHRPHALDSFRLVQDPAAFPGFAPPTKVRSCPPHYTVAYSCSSTFRGTRRHRPSSFLVRTRILLVRVSPRHARRRSRLPIRERPH
jgi:hypothetical protein